MDGGGGYGGVDGGGGYGGMYGVSFFHAFQGGVVWCGEFGWES